MSQITGLQTIQEQQTGKRSWLLQAVHSEAPPK
jgi:hypothetical protein